MNSFLDIAAKIRPKRDRTMTGSPSAKLPATAPNPTTPMDMIVTVPEANTEPTPSIDNIKWVLLSMKMPLIKPNAKEKTQKRLIPRE